MAGFSPIAGPGLPGDVLKKKKEEEEKKASAKTSASAGPQPQPQKSQAYYDGGARRRQTNGTEPEAKKTEKKKTAETGVFSPIAGTQSALARMRNRMENENDTDSQKIFEDLVKKEYERTAPSVQKTAERFGLAPRNDLQTVRSAWNAISKMEQERQKREEEQKKNEKERIRRQTQREVDEYKNIFGEINETLWKMETANQRNPGTYTGREFSVYRARQKNVGKILADLYRDRGELEEMYRVRSIISGADYENAEQRMRALAFGRIVPAGGVAAVADLQKEVNETKPRARADELGAKYAEKLYTDEGNAVSDFFNRFGANYTLGKLGTEANSAGFSYATSPSIGGNYLLDTVSDLTERFIENNKDIVNTGGLVSKDFASYLPQLLDQAEYSMIYGPAVAGPVGMATGRLDTGLKAGALFGSGLYSYQQAFGDSFNQFRTMTDFDTAKELANDEALLSSGVEMIGTAADLVSLGFGKVFSKLSKTLGKEAVEQASKTGLLKFLGGYAANVIGEMGEEGLQEIVRIANERRLKSGNAGSGVVGLTETIIDVIDDIGHGRNQEDWNRVKEAGIAGGRTALVAGGSQLAANTLIGNLLDRRNTQSGTVQGREAGNGKSAGGAGVNFDDILAIGRAENGQNETGSDVLYAISDSENGEGDIYDYTKPFAEQVEDWKRGKIPKYDTLLVSGTPEVFKEIGFNALPVTINQTHVAYAYNGKNGDIKGDHIIKDLIKKLPEALKRPLAVIASDSRQGRVVVLLGLDKPNTRNKIVVPVEIDGRGRQNNISIDSNALTSVYGKNNALIKLKEAIENDSVDDCRLFYWNKNEALSLLQRAGLQLPSAMPQDGFVHSIRESGSKVNMKFENVTESQQFKRRTKATAPAGRTKQENGQNETGSDVLYAIRYDQNNVPFVEVEDDILAGLNQKEKQAKVKEILKDRFSEGVSVGNELVKVNAVSRNELLNSKNSRYYKKNLPDIYHSKLNASTQLDEVVRASRDYVGEELKHARKDDIKEFARGTVNMRIGGKDYSADVVIGTTKKGSLVFYDLINFKPETIKERASIAFSASNNVPYSAQAGDALSNSSIPHIAEHYNPDLQKSGLRDQDGRGVLFDETVQMEQETADNGQAERRDASGELGDVGNTPRTGETENRMLGALTRVANALGYRVIQTPRQDVMEGAGISSDVDGYVDKNRKEIYINPNAREPINVVMKHEITHVLENVSDTYLTKARNYIKSALPGLWEETQVRVQEKYDRLGIDATGRLESETMAEIAETLSTDEAILRYGTSEKVTRNIAMWFSYMAKKVKSVFGDLSVQEKLEVASYKWQQALRRAERQNAQSGTSAENAFRLFSGRNRGAENAPAGNTQSEAVKSAMDRLFGEPDERDIEFVGGGNQTRNTQSAARTFRDDAGNEIEIVGGRTQREQNAQSQGASAQGTTEESPAMQQTRRAVARRTGAPKSTAQAAARRQTGNQTTESPEETQRRIARATEELEQLNSKLADESLSDEDYRRLDRRSRALEREISILIGRQAQQYGPQAGTETSVQDQRGETEAPAYQPRRSPSMEGIRQGVQTYQETGDPSGLPTKKQADQSMKNKEKTLEEIDAEIANLENALEHEEMAQEERAFLSFQLSKALIERLQKREDMETLAEALEALREVDDAARPNHDWISEISKDLSDKDSIMRYGTYGFNDFYRNIRNFFGKKYFKQATEKILLPLYRSKEAYADMVGEYSDLIYNRVVKGLGIKKGSKLSAAVQWLGEGQKPVSNEPGAELADYTYDDCVAEFGAEKAARIKEAAEIFRQCYDELIDRVNETRRRLYPNNPSKLIQKRRDYFRHFAEESGNIQGLRNAMQNHAGIDPMLVGVSEYTRPKSKWQSFAQQRTGNRTDYDAVGGFLNYLPQAAYSVHIDPNIINIRALAYDLAKAKAKENVSGNPNANRFIEYLQRYANLLSGKTVSHLDRMIASGNGGRKFLAAITWLNNRIKSNAVLGNFSSMLSQIMNITNAAGKIRRESDMGKGAWQTLAGVFGNKKIQDRYKESGFLKERFLNKKLDRFDSKLSPTKWAAAALGIADEIGTRITWNAAYEEGLRVAPNDPVQYADDFTRESVAGRGIGDLPLNFESQMAKLFLPFRVEVNNTVNVWQDILFNERYDGKAKNAGYNVLKFTEYMVACAVVNAVIGALKTDEFNPIDDLGEDEPLKALLTDWADGYGDSVGPDFLHDVVSGVMQGQEEADEKESDMWDRAGLTFLRPIQNVLGDIVSNHPVSNAAMGIVGMDTDMADMLFNGKVYNPGGFGMPLASNATSGVRKMGDGKIVAGLVDWGKNTILPWGGTQIDKAVRGIYELRNGATTGNVYDRLWADIRNYEGERLENARGTLKYVVEPTWENIVKSALFGPSSFGGENDDYYNDTTRRIDDAETGEILSLPGYEARKTRLDEIIAVNRYNSEKDDRQEEAEESYYGEGKDGSVLYEMYKNGNSKALPFWNIPLDLKATIDETKYEAELTPDEAKRLGENLNAALEERFAELDASPEFANLPPEAREKMLNSFVDYEREKMKADYFYESGQMTKEAHDDYVLDYQRKVAKKERDLFVGDVQTYIAYQALDVERQYYQYAVNLSDETKRQVQAYTDYARTREADDVDREVMRVANATGSDINVGGNPAGILSYSKDKVDYVIQMPDTETYRLMDEVDSACRTALSQNFATAAYKNATDAQKKEMISNIKQSVRAQVKKRYKALYPSVRVEVQESVQ